MQARVAGMNDSAAARDAIVDLDVAMIVPAEGSHSAVAGQSQGGQRIGEFFGSNAALGEGVSKQRPVRLSRNDLSFPALCGSVLDDRGDQQGPIHHESWLKHYFN